MMKNLFKLSLAMLFTMALITSCEKDEKEEVKKPTDQTTKAITATEMQNKDNPYEEQGVLYESFLNAISSNDEQGLGGWDVGRLTAFRGDIGDWKLEQINKIDEQGVGNWDVGHLAISDNQGVGNWDVGHVVSFGMAVNDENGKDTSANAKRNLKMQIEALSGLKMIDIESECWYHPSRCKDNRIINPVNLLKASNGGNARNRTINYINAVRKQEAIIMVDDSMNKETKIAVMTSYSIARHAAGYWYNQSKDSGEAIDKVTINMVHLSTLGSSTCSVMVNSTKETGISTAILNTYVATGRAKTTKDPAN